MNKRTTAAALAGLVGLAAPLAAPATAQAAGPASGTTSIAEVLAADGLEFDHDWQDFDILDQAVNDVISAKPDTAVAVLADGDTALTAFAPTDRAFRRLVNDLTGHRPANEQATYDAVGSLGVDTVEAVLLYHVVPGEPITYRQAQRANGARLESALGPKIRVKVWKKSRQVFLRDQDPNDRNPRVIRGLRNINQGNEQIAHGISRVLRPADL